MDAKHWVVCFSVAALAMTSSVTRADLIQIDDLRESIVVTFTGTGFGSLGPIVNTGESVVIPYMLANSLWAGDTFIAIQLIEPPHGGSGGVVSDLWTFRTFDGTPDAVITFSSDPANLSVPPGAQLLGAIFETSSYQRLLNGFLSVEVRSEIPEPGTVALFGLGLAGLGFARRSAVIGSSSRCARGRRGPATDRNRPRRPVRPTGAASSGLPLH